MSNSQSRLVRAGVEFAKGSGLKVGDGFAKVLEAGFGWGVGDGFAKEGGERGGGLGRRLAIGY